MTPANTLSEEQIAAQWTRLGASFNVAPARKTPDIERLLLDTVRFAHRNGRFFIMAATWLVQYSDYVAKRRLAVLINDELEPRYRPVMGLLLEWAESRSSAKNAPFREAIAKCRPAENPAPLLDVSRRNHLLIQLAKQQASALSRKWGCWFEDFAPKTDAIRPPEWIGQSNPSLALRAITGGDLVATIAADAAAGQSKFPSESSLARRYGASRASVRAALRKLTLAGFVQQPFRGKSKTVVVAIEKRRAR
ncbi:MAG: GntR family transcriptional regulator [Phycisphaerae bacterium]